MKEGWLFQQGYGTFWQQAALGLCVETTGRGEHVSPLRGEAACGNGGSVWPDLYIFRENLVLTFGLNFIKIIPHETKKNIWFNSFCPDLPTWTLHFCTSRGHRVCMKICILSPHPHRSALSLLSMRYHNQLQRATRLFPQIKQQQTKNDSYRVTHNSKTKAQTKIQIQL